MSGTVLIVDDDRKTVGLVKLYLENEGFQVLFAHDGGSALQLARNNAPDLIVLDLMLPKVDGIDICRIMRSESDVPIIMLTARTTEDDKLLGLDVGADDYITKPFSPREVLARVKAVLRRTSNGHPQEKNEVVFGDLIIDFARHAALVNGEELHLTPKEFKLLEIFARNPGRAFSRAELLDAAFGPEYAGLERTVDVHIMNLRKKIEEPQNPSVQIKTVYGVGYKLIEEPDVS